MKKLKIVFMGTPEFAVPSFLRIADSSHQIVGVVTQPDRPRGRGQTVLPTPVKKQAQKLSGVPVYQPEKLSDQNFIEQLKSLKADIFVVVAFRILPESVYSMPPHGTINLHPSLLPKYRGAAPVNWTIINGEKETGVTIIKISRQIDSGGILAQTRVPVLENETAGSLHDRLANTGADLLIKTIDSVAGDTLTILPQNESEATPAPKLTKEMCHISFDQPVEKVKNWIHGLSPHPGAYAFLDHEMIKFYVARIAGKFHKETPPGKIVNPEKGEIHIACNPGIINILELQKQGKKVLSNAEFLRGFSFKKDDVFH
ncbi:MAG: methionyl-tRNA formyltransferase [Calditrichota bacterium]